jgi:hypothetical protein
VGTDAEFEPVEDGVQLEGGVQVAEAAFGLAQVLLAERDRPVDDPHDRGSRERASALTGPYEAVSVGARIHDRLLLGHSDQIVTARHYVYLLADEQLDAFAAVQGVQHLAGDLAGDRGGAGKR